MTFGIFWYGWGQVGARALGRSLALLKFLDHFWISRVYSLKNWVVVTEISKIWVTMTQIFRK